MLTPTDLRLQDDILGLLSCHYRTDRGEEIQGQSISHLSHELRDRRWKGVSNLNDLESVVERLGFKVVEAQGYRWGGDGGPNGMMKLGRFARVVTL